MPGRRLLAQPSEFFGREGEQCAIAALLAAARAGRSGVLVIRGEAGVGKSALLARAAQRATGMPVLSATGVESEVDLPFAALHQLLLPVLERRNHLPAPQFAALNDAFGLGGMVADRPDRFLVATAVLTLLADVAEDEPVLLLVDDAQWLDPASAQALVFVAHRLEAEAVALLLSARMSDWRQFRAPSLPSLELHGLDPAAARALLDRGRRSIAAPVRDRLIEEVGGNPLALTELPATLSADQLAGRQPLPARLPLGAALEEIFLNEVRDLPAETQTALLVAAAEGSGDAATVLAAVDLIAGAEKLEPAERAGLLRITAQGQVRFRHPLVRSAVYQSAPIADRLAAHTCLAQVLAGEHRADQRAWHLAAAATGPDEQVASALERTADRAARRGGTVAAADALERAAALTPDAARHAGRLVAAAEAAWDAGQPERARVLLDAAEPYSTRPRCRARIAGLRGWIEHISGTPTTASVILAEGAAPIMRSDPDLARDLLILAARSAWLGNEPAWLIEIGERLQQLPGAHDAEFGQLALLIVELGHDRLPRHGSQHQALAETSTPGQVPEDPRPWIWPPTFLPELLGDELAISERLTKLVAALRARGVIGMLPVALTQLTPVEVVLGRWNSAVSHASEGIRLAQETEQPTLAAYLRSMLAWLAAARGRADDCRRLVGEACEFAVPHEHVAALTFTSWASGLLALGQGQPDQALARLLPLATPKGPGGGHYLLGRRATGDLVEAAVLAGQAEAAVPVLAEFEAWTRHNQQPWAIHLARRCRGLLSADDAVAERSFQAALTPDGGGQQRLRPFQFARTELSYGEWLRRGRRRSDARPHLRAALEIFDRLAAAPWAERARAELRASGESARKRDPSTLQQLTPQERQIADRAARGLTNRQIGAELFLSPRTVAYHLHNIFPKLGIASRAELQRHDLTSPPSR